MRVFLASIAITVAILISVLPELFSRQQLQLHERRVERQLEELLGQGAMVLPESLDKAVFSIPLKSFFFGAGFTYGQLRKEIAKQNRDGTPPLERSAHFIEYARYIASAFARGTRYEDHISINEPPRAEFLNLYFARHIYGKQSTMLQTPQCSYLGFANAVLCDSDSIARASQK